MSVDITVNDLIIRAFETIGIYSPYKLLSGEQLLSGLYYFNEMLDYFQSSGLYIPYYTDVSFDMVATQNEYVVSKDAGSDVNSNPIIELDYVTISYATQYDTSYPVSIVTYDQYDMIVRNNSTTARPTKVILQKGVDTSKLIFFPVPDVAYRCNFRGKLYLSDVDIQDHLYDVPGYYHRFLRYALARELKDIYKSENWNAFQENEYKTMLSEIKSSADFALAINQNPTFGVQTVTQDSRMGVIF